MSGPMEHAARYRMLPIVRENPEEPEATHFQYDSVVEVAGIEPASGSLQLEETTCLADPFSFADAPFEPAGTSRR